MKKTIWIIAGFSILLNILLVYLFVIKGSTVKANDSRIAIELSEEHQDFALAIKIHTNLGFRKVGYREKIGKMDKPNGIWRDYILLERRSKNIGIRAQ